MHPALVATSWYTLLLLGRNGLLRLLERSWLPVANTVALELRGCSLQLTRMPGAAIGAGLLPHSGLALFIGRYHRRQAGRRSRLPAIAPLRSGAQPSRYA